MAAYTGDEAAIEHRGSKVHEEYGHHGEFMGCENCYQPAEEDTQKTPQEYNAAL